MVVPLPARVSLTYGIDVHTAFPDRQATAILGCLYHRLTRPRTSPLNPIFMIGGAPKAHDVLPKGGRDCGTDPACLGKAGAGKTGQRSDPRPIGGKTGQRSDPRPIGGKTGQRSDPRLCRPFIATLKPPHGQGQGMPTLP